MSEMVERAARAAAAAFMATDLPERLSRREAPSPEVMQIIFRGIAVATIEAIKEPTDQMILAGMEYEGTRAAWDAMIEAALKDPT